MVNETHKKYTLNVDVRHSDEKVLLKNVELFTILLREGFGTQDIPSTLYKLISWLSKCYINGYVVAAGSNLSLNLDVN